MRVRRPANNILAIPPKYYKCELLVATLGILDPRDLQIIRTILRAISAELQQEPEFGKLFGGPVVLNRAYVILIDSFKPETQRRNIKHVSRLLCVHCQEQGNQNAKGSKIVIDLLMLTGRENLTIFPIHNKILTVGL